jgi:rhamnosyl/mannosyltransferase
LRILQVNKLYAPTIGGVETWVRQIAEGLSDRADVRVLVCQEKGEAAEEIYNGVRLTRAKSYGRLLSMPISIDFFRQFRRMAREADIVQLHAPFPLADLALWLLNPKAKVAVWWHSDIVRQRSLGMLLAPFMRHTLKRAGLVVAATEGHIKSSAYLRELGRKCKVIPFGLNFAEYPVPLGKSPLKPHDQRNKKLLFVGRLVYYKGVKVLLKAMGRVSGAELFIVGDGPLRSEVERLVDDKIHWLGSLPREELLAAFYNCDIFVFPSVANSEAFGIAQLEAMCYGKPVINTNLPTGVPYVSVDGETGLTVAVGDVGALAAAITRLVDDDDLRLTYGENAARRVRERFERGAALERLYEEYEAL